MGNPHLDYAYELVRDVKFPIMKRKYVSLSRFKNVRQTVNYILTHMEFDIGLIYSHVKWLQREGRYNVFYPFQKDAIEHFHNTYK